jgi:hypothetical protein
MGKGWVVASARTKVMSVAGFALAVAVGVSGCGAAKQLSAKDQVSKAFTGLNGASSATFTLSLDTTAADVAAISKAEGDPMSASDQKTLQQVINGDIVLAVNAPAGKTFGDETQSGAGSQDFTSLLSDPTALSAALKKQGAFSANIQLSGASLVELRSLNGVIYARANVKKILSLAGQNPNELDSQLGSLPPSLAPLAKAAKGEWVSIDLVKAAQAAKDSGVLNELPTATASPVDSAKVTKLVNDLKAAYQKNATITSLGSGDKGDGYRLSAPAKQIATSVQPDLIDLVGQSGATEIRKSIAQIPNKNVNLDLWVKDDQFTDVNLDLTQFLKKPVTGKKLNLDIGINVGSGKVTAPSGVTEIDVKQIMSAIPAALGAGLGSGLTAGSSSSSSGSGSASATGLTKEQIKELKASGMTNAEIKQLEDAQKAAAGN